MVKYGYKDKEESKRNKVISLLVTIVLHGCLLFCFCFFGLSHQVPPPPEYGIEVDMGGGGGGSAAKSETIKTSTDIAHAAKEELMTQDVEETTTLPSSPKTSTRPKTQPTTTTNSQEKTTPVSPEQSVNPNAMFRRNKGGGGGGSGSGEGTGIGSGSGTGIGSGSGSGIGTSGGDFFLNGRPVEQKAFPKSKNNLEGMVKVEFRADKDGKVVYAKAGSRGTTISDPQIWEECEKAAYKSKFKAKADANAEEKGVITYRFVLQ